MILTALQSAARRLQSRTPGTFFGATANFEAELCDLINEVAADIAQYQDWQALVRVATITADGSNEYDLPDGYQRMLLDSQLQDLQNWAWGYYAFQDINSFLLEEARGFAPWPGGWIIYNNQLRFSPTPSGSTTFPYVSKNWARPTTGADKAAFSADTDTFLLPERLLTLGLVWRWRENKKLDSTGDMEAFTKALDEYAAKDGGSKVIRFSGRRMGWNRTLAYSGFAY